MSTDDSAPRDAVGPVEGPIEPPEWQRPPFEPGNTLSLIHGTYSERTIVERAEGVHDQLLAVAPWLDHPHFAPSVDRYLKATARELLAQQALAAMQPGAKGFTRLMEAATAAARLAWQMGDQLGLTPAGHAKLKILAAGATGAELSLADLAAEGREAWRQRQPADAEATVEDGA